MRALILEDKNIPEAHIEKLKKGLKGIIEGNTNIKIEFFDEARDFSYYPIFEDSDGDMRPTNTWLRQLTSEIYGRYKEDVDHIFILIHEDHWRSGRIWGTNYSNYFSGYQVHYCRYDKDNQANTLGTAWHEYMHSPDGLLKVYCGIDIEDYISSTQGITISDWDQSVTHGRHLKAKYIRHRENVEWLQYIADPLERAYKERRRIYFETVKRPLMEQIVNLAERAVVLLRQKLNQKNGVRQ